MATPLTFAVPEQFIGKTLNQIGGLGRADVLGGFLGISENAPLTAGQILTLPSNIPGVDPSGSAEIQGLMRAFGQGITGGERLATEQRGQEEEFLGRFREVVGGLETLPDISARLEQELGGELGATPTELGQSAAELLQTLRNIPGQERNIARGVAISAPRIQQRISQRQAEISPQALRSAELSQFASGELGRRSELAVTQQQRELLPFEVEAGQISERLAREVTLFTAERSDQLARDLDALGRGERFDMFDLKRIADEALSEEEFERQKELFTFKLEEKKRLAGGTGTATDLDVDIDAALIETGEVVTT